MSLLQALELNGQDLLGRSVRLDLAKERGAYTPASGYEHFFTYGFSDVCLSSFISYVTQIFVEMREARTKKKGEAK